MWIVVVIVAIVLLIAFPWLWWIVLALAALFIGLIIKARKDAKSNPKNEYYPPEPLTTSEYLGTSYRVSVPAQRNPMLYDKRSKIVSIFTKKWCDVAAKEFVVIDIETTGLDKCTDSIVEISALKYIDGQFHSKYTSLVNPKRHIPDEVVQIHGITNAMVRGSPTIDKVIPELLDYLGDSLLVGHNVNFDVGFIEVAARKLGYNPEWKYVDTISVAKKILPGLPNYKQKTILDHIGFSQTQYHRAEADCYGCAEIIQLGLNSVIGTL